MIAQNTCLVFRYDFSPVVARDLDWQKAEADCELKSSYCANDLETLNRGQKDHNAFLPAFFAAAQRAFAARDNFLFNAALIFRLGFRILIPEDAERRSIRFPRRASIAATRRSRCWVNSSTMLLVSIGLEL